MSFLLSLPGKIGMAALVLCLAFFGGYWSGGKNAKSQAEVEALSKAVKILRERNTVDETINAVDAAALCGAMGLSDDDQNECLRRLEEANP